MPANATILIVDDYEENLVALQAILQPLGQRLISARSGDEALAHLLVEDVALILLDVQMPGMDGFETAGFIKRRRRTRETPIIFLTAQSTETTRAFEGYSVGAVDYLQKPFDPMVLRSKVQVFIDLWEKAERIRHQEQQLRLAAEEARRRDVEAERRASEERHRRLAEAIPHIVWMADPDGTVEYFNELWHTYTGASIDDAGDEGWSVALHPEDRTETTSRWQQAVAQGTPFEAEYRFRRADGTYRWQLGRAVPVRDAGGDRASWIGTSTDIHDRKLLEFASNFLVDAGTVLSSTLRYEQALQHVARLAVESSIADWCSIELTGADGSFEHAAVARGNAIDDRLADALLTTCAQAATLEPGPRPTFRVGDALVLVGGHDAADAQSVGVELHSLISSEIVARDQSLGAVVLFRLNESSHFTEQDVSLVRELAGRIGSSVDTSRLFHKAEHRAQAATALATVADGVLLTDLDGVVRIWNPAASAITGLAASAVEGRPIDAVIPGWSSLPAADPAADPGTGMQVETLPLEIDGRELWLAVSTARFDAGSVYTFRDVTEQRLVDKMKSDFVATVSHELRTPLAAISGAASTISRDDVTIDEASHRLLLTIIVEQSERLNDMIQNLLLASRLESRMVSGERTTFTVAEVVRETLDSARAYAPERIDLHADLPDSLPQLGCDREHLRQVLTNFVENAIKYSPAGGRVTVRAQTRGERVQLSVSDEGMGIPKREQGRIFEKFYRLDANMTRGIGGSGLGLYICNELVRLMGGRIHVDSAPGRGSTFSIEVPSVLGRRTAERVDGARDAARHSELSA